MSEVASSLYVDGGTQQTWAPTPLKQGWIRKGSRRAGGTSDISGATKLRYFVLDPLQLYYGAGEDVTTPTSALGVLPMDSTVAVETIDSTTLVLVGSFAKTGKEYVLIFDTFEQKLEWESAIRAITAVLPQSTALGRRFMYPSSTRHDDQDDDGASSAAGSDGDPCDALDETLNVAQLGTEAAVAEVEEARRRKELLKRSKAGFLVAGQISSTGQMGYLRVEFSWETASATPTALTIEVTSEEALATVMCIDGKGVATPLLYPQYCFSLDKFGSLVAALHHSSMPDSPRFELRFKSHARDDIELYHAGDNLCCCLDTRSKTWSFRGGRHACCMQRAEQSVAENEPFKLTIIGGSGVGKSTLLHWLQQSQSVKRQRGLSFRHKIGAVERRLKVDVGGGIVEVSATELPGTASLGLLRSHCESADLILFVFDFTDAFSLSWLSSFSNILPKADSVTRKRELIFVGTRSDDPRVVVDGYRVGVTQKEACQALGVNDAIEPTLWRIPVSLELKAAEGGAPLRRMSSIGTFRTLKREAEDVFMDNVKFVLRTHFLHHTLWQHGFRTAVSTYICNTIQAVEDDDATNAPTANQPSSKIMKLLDALNVMRPLHGLIPTMAALGWEQIDQLQEMAGGGHPSGGWCEASQTHHTVQFTAWLVAGTAVGDLTTIYIVSLVETALIEKGRTPAEEQDSAATTLPSALDVMDAFIDPSDTSQCFLMHRNITDIFKAVRINVSGPPLSQLARAMDIDGDQVISEADFTSWWQFPDAVTMQYGGMSALFAGLMKHRLVQHPDRLEAGTRNDLRPDSSASGLHHGTGSVLVGDPTSNTNHCRRCGAVFSLFRQSTQCANCTLAFCSECISDVNTVNNQTGRVMSSRVCYNCQGIAQPKRWEEDTAAVECTLCSLPFTVLRRRHHCRACGIVVCADCAPNSIAVHGYAKPQRVCTSCEAASHMVASKKRRGSGPRRASAYTLHQQQEDINAASPDTIRRTAIANRRNMKEEITYDLPWNELYDSDDERVLFRNNPPPPYNPHSPTSEYIVLTKGLTEHDVTFGEPPLDDISAGDMVLMGPDVFSADD